MGFSKKTTLILTADDIEKIVRIFGLDEIMDQLIERLHLAIKNFDPEKTEIPVRSGFNYKKPASGLVEWMPLHQVGSQVLIKMVGYHPDNPQNYQLPTIISTISAYDTNTGHLKGLMDGVFLTALRTGAASAVASKFLAAPVSSILGLIGCGAQAVTQLHALSRVFNLTEVHYFDIHPATQESFAERVRLLGLNLKLIPSTINEIVPKADILCTATSIEIGAGPLFDDISTKPWLHINAVGSDFPGKTELPKSFLQQSFVCPDFLAQAIAEGECQQLDATEIAPDIFTAIQNGEKYDWVKKTRSVFDSTGLSLEDEVVMNLFLEQARELNLGQEVHIENLQADAKNPYHFLATPVESSANHHLNIVEE